MMIMYGALEVSLGEYFANAAATPAPTPIPSQSENFNNRERLVQTICSSCDNNNRSISRSPSRITRPNS